MFFNKTDIGSNKIRLDDSVRPYCTLTTCRRKLILEHFGYNISRTNTTPCCDNCESVTNTVQSDCHSTSLHQQQTIKVMLTKYFDAENNVMSCSAASGPSYTGLNETVLCFGLLPSGASVFHKRILFKLTYHHTCLYDSRTMESHKGPVAVDVFSEQVGSSHVR